MALEKMTGLPGIMPTKPNDPASANTLGKGGAGSMSGTDFRQALDTAIGGAASGPNNGLSGAGAVANPRSIQALLDPNGTASSGAQSLKFSNHAIERMHSRGISFSPETIKSIENAVGKAAQKGSKDTLVLTGDSALIVSVKNKTVVTVMDRQAMKDNVFTNIDSTVMV